MTVPTVGQTGMPAGAVTAVLVAWDEGAGAWKPVSLDAAGGITIAISDYGAGHYETVAANQSDQALGAAGATGDYLAGLLIVPGSTSLGAVSVKDDSLASITVFAGGVSSVSNLVPFFVPLGIKSTGGPWQVTTGSNVSVVAVGKFT